MEIGGTRQIFPPGGAAAMPMVIGGVAGVRRAFVICASTVLRGICMIAAMSSIDRPWGKISDVNRRPNSTPYLTPPGLLWDMVARNTGLMHCSKYGVYSITSSARASSVGARRGRALCRF